MRLYILFHHVVMFMYPCVYSISPYCYVYVSKLLALFHHVYVMYPCFSLYFTILLCLCIQVTDTISPYYLYIYVSMRLLYFTILLCYVSKLLALFHYTDMLCIQTTYTISPCDHVYVSMFLFYFTISLCMFMCPHLCTISPCIL